MAVFRVLRTSWWVIKTQDVFICIQRVRLGLCLLLQTFLWFTNHIFNFIQTVRIIKVQLGVKRVSIYIPERNPSPSESGQIKLYDPERDQRYFVDLEQSMVPLNCKGLCTVGVFLEFENEKRKFQKCQDRNSISQFMCIVLCFITGDTTGIHYLSSKSFLVSPVPLSTLIITFLPEELSLTWL